MRRPVLLNVERLGRVEHGLPGTYGGRTAVGGLLREIVNKYAACGWLVAQMDHDGRQRFGAEWVESRQFP